MGDRELLELAAKAAGIAVMLAMTGCTEPNATSRSPTMQEIAESMECSVEQYAQVNKQAEWCNKNTGYLSTYCYDRATVKLCSKPTIAAAAIGAKGEM